jgi:hypothetical protein
MDKFAKYIHVVEWARLRYMQGTGKGRFIVLAIGGELSKYTIIERLAASKYLNIEVQA